MLRLGQAGGTPLDDYGVPEWILIGAASCATLAGTISLALGGSTLGMPAEAVLMVAAVAPWWLRSRITSRSALLTLWIFVPPAILVLTGESPFCVALLALGTARLAVFAPFWQGPAYAAASMAVIAARWLEVGWSDWYVWKTYVELGLALGWALRSFRVSVLKEREATGERSRRAVADERRRIARDVHDAIAHSLSVMMLQLSGAQLLIEDDPAAAGQALDEAVLQGRRSLDEIRRVVGLLGSTPDGGSDGSATQADDEIDSLVTSYRDAGLDVDLTVTGGAPEPEPDRESASGGTRDAAYRIVQESLANAVKHAPGTTVTIALVWSAEELSMRITNPITDGRARARPGQGVRGMRERARQLDGALTCGPIGKEWEMHCVLPLRPRPTASGATPTRFEAAAAR